MVLIPMGGATGGDVSGSPQLTSGSRTAVSQSRPCTSTFYIACPITDDQMAPDGPVLVAEIPYDGSISLVGKNEE